MNPSPVSEDNLAFANLTLFAVAHKLQLLGVKTEDAKRSEDPAVIGFRLTHGTGPTALYWRAGTGMSGEAYVMLSLQHDGFDVISLMFQVNKGARVQSVEDLASAITVTLGHHEESHPKFRAHYRTVVPGLLEASGGAESEASISFRDAIVLLPAFVTLFNDPHAES